MSDNDFDFDSEDAVIIKMSKSSAANLARAMRMLNSRINLTETFELMDTLAVSLGSALGISTDSDDTDPLDEALSDGDVIEWDIYDASDFSDHSSSSSETVTFVELGSNDSGPRYSLSAGDGPVQIIDNYHHLELCTLGEYQVDEDGNFTDDARIRGQDICNVLNDLNWHWQPKLAA